VALDRAACDRQAEARARKALGAGQPAQRLDHEVAAGHVEADAIVGERERKPVIALEVDPRARPRAGELPGVGEQVLQRERDQPGIRQREQPLADPDVDRARRIAEPQIGEHAMRDRSEIHRLAVQLATGHFDSSSRPSRIADIRRVLSWSCEQLLAARAQRVAVIG